MSPASALLTRDLRLALRQGGGLGTAIGFFLAVVVLLPLSIGPDQSLLQEVAPGTLWITLLLSVLLSADRMFQIDLDDGSLELMIMGVLPFAAVTLLKALGHWLIAGLPLAIAAPLLGFLVNIAPAQVLPLALAMLAGSLGLSLTAALGAAVTAGLRRGGVLVSLLVLPLNVPIVVFGVAASAAPLEGSVSLSPALALVIALSMAALVMVPIAASAALKAHVR